MGLIVLSKQLLKIFETPKMWWKHRRFLLVTVTQVLLMLLCFVAHIHGWKKTWISVWSPDVIPPQSKFTDPPEFHLRTQQDERPQGRHESKALPSDNLVGLLSFHSWGQRDCFLVPQLPHLRNGIINNYNITGPHFLGRREMVHVKLLE